MSEHHTTNDQQASGDIDAFLSSGPFAVVGASTNRDKYGNKVLRAYLQNDKPVLAINPRADEIEGVTSYASLSDLPEVPHGISIITPPAITEKVIDEVIALGIKHIWMQPGAEHDGAIERALAAGVNVIGHGPCALVVMGYSER